jgi:hypothetical protein
MGNYILAQQLILNEQRTTREPAEAKRLYFEPFFCYNTEVRSQIPKTKFQGDSSNFSRFLLQHHPENTQSNLGF